MGPIIIEPIKAQNVSENMSFEMVVEYENKDDNIVKWYRNNQLLEPNDDCDIVNENGKSRIKIHNADKKKAGKYEVVIERNNIITKSASSVKLVKTNESEIVPPIFIRPLRPKEVCLGDIVLLETEVISSPCASFQWFIDTKEVVSYAKEKKLNNIYVTNRDNISCLCIENITKDLVGVMTCRAENFAGSVSCSASLVLIPMEKEIMGEAPSFIKLLDSTTVMDGEPIALTCKVMGQPWPKIDWYHDGKSIEKARDIIVARQASGLCELCIKEAFPEMAGTYCCKATNEFGSCSSECILNVEGSKEVPVLMVACYCMNGKRRIRLIHNLT